MKKSTFFLVFFNCKLYFVIYNHNLNYKQVKLKLKKSFQTNITALIRVVCIELYLKNLN